MKSLTSIQIILRRIELAAYRRGRQTRPSACAAVFVSQNTESIMPQVYMSGCTNYGTHEAAREAFSKIESAAALRLCPDGSAYIATLLLKPIQPNQVEFQLAECSYKGPV